MSQRSALHYLAIFSLLALTGLCLGWETWLSPLRPGGSWMMLKALPLTIPVNGIVRGRIYTFQWASMLILAYFAEGIVRCWSEHGLSSGLAFAALALSMTFFLASVSYVHLARSEERRVGKK